jgi:hypothetical protein
VRGSPPLRHNCSVWNGPLTAALKTGRPFTSRNVKQVCVPSGDRRVCENAPHTPRFVSGDPGPVKISYDESNLVMETEHLVLRYGNLPIETWDGQLTVTVRRDCGRLCVR